MSITLYSTNCSKCKILKKKLDEKEICYIVNTDEELMKEKEYMSLPVLDVDGSELFFSEAIKWIRGVK
jgi:arsenate reductase-like glutaredoxin family protein